MAEVLNQNLKTTAHYIVSEAAGYRSRDTGMVAANSGKMLAGFVCGIVTASGEFAPFDPAATDGSETAAAILYEGVEDSTTAQRRTFTRRDTEIHADVLEWKTGVTDVQKTAALASLAEHGIIAR